MISNLITVLENKTISFDSYLFREVLRNKDLAFLFNDKFVVMNSDFVLDDLFPEGSRHNLLLDKDPVSLYEKYKDSSSQDMGIIFCNDYDALDMVDTFIKEEFLFVYCGKMNPLFNSLSTKIYLLHLHSLKESNIFINNNVWDMDLVQQDKLTDELFYTLYILQRKQGVVLPICDYKNLIRSDEFG